MEVSRGTKIGKVAWGYTSYRTCMALFASCLFPTFIEASNVFVEDNAVASVSSKIL